MNPAPCPSMVFEDQRSSTLESRPGRDARVDEAADVSRDVQMQLYVPTEDAAAELITASYSFLIIHKFVRTDVQWGSCPRSIKGTRIKQFQSVNK